MSTEQATVVGLDHVTIRTRDLNAARDFFIKVFDLFEGTRLAAIQQIPGHWLYAGDRPLVHLIGSHGGISEISLQPTILLS